MGGPKQRAVINAERSQLEQVQRLVENRRYRTVSEFVREAVTEKLERIERDRVAEGVARYCAAGHADEDVDLIASQAFTAARRSPSRRGARRGSR